MLKQETRKVSEGRDGNTSEMKSARYRAINPMGKVPALRHRSVAVTETAAICAYLADAFPEDGLAPAARERAGRRPGRRRGVSGVEPSMGKGPALASVLLDPDQ